MARTEKVRHKPNDFSQDISVFMPIDTQTVVDYLSGGISDGYCNYWLQEVIVDADWLKKDFKHEHWSNWRQLESNDNRTEIKRHLEEKSYCYTHEIPFLGGELTIIELDDYNHNPKPLNMKTIVEGCQAMAINSPYHFKDLVNESGDAITSDVLLQYCVFGEIIYG
jgi:hypothetical protein